jgi:TonB family protein
MFRKISLLITLAALGLSLCGPVSGQKTATTEQSDRERDGLLGPVRRVTIESSKITFKNGEGVEGSKVLRAVTTYDVNGKKIDSVAHPVEGTAVAGKEQYKYDAKGNIVEMQLRGPDGGILSKETYAYKFDELGNWKQMTTSITVFQDGKIGEEPIEVTYRTITYFYNQEVARVASGASPRQTTTAPTKSTTSVAMKPPQVLSEPVAGSASKSNKAEPNTPGVSGKIQNTSSAGSDASSDAAKPAPVETPSSTPSTPPPVAITVKRVSEDTLRTAAISLPEPSYPQAAELSRTEGRVNVDLIIDEKGVVTNARATSANALLNEAAEAAARAARFAPASLSTEPARISGTLSYNFVLPKTAAPDASSKTNKEEKTVSNPKQLSANTSAPAVPAPVPEPAGTTESFYSQGVMYLDEGKLTEAVDVLKQAVHKDPESAPAYVKLGLAYSALRQYKEAVAVFKMAIQIKRDSLDAEAYYNLGHSYSGIGKHADALNAFKQALYISRAEAINAEEQKSVRTPSAAELHYSIALANSNMGRYSDAIKELKQVIEMNPQFAEAYFGLAVCYIGLGDRNGAEKQQRILATMNPDLADKVSQALGPNRNLPPGVSEGILGGRRRP